VFFVAFGEERDRKRARDHQAGGGEGGRGFVPKPSPEKDVFARQAHRKGHTFILTGGGRGFMFWIAGEGGGGKLSTLNLPERGGASSIFATGGKRKETGKPSSSDPCWGGLYHFNCSSLGKERENRLRWMRYPALIFRGKEEWCTMNWSIRLEENPLYFFH